MLEAEEELETEEELGPEVKELKQLVKVKVKAIEMDCEKRFKLSGALQIEKLRRNVRDKKIEKGD